MDSTAPPRNMEDGAAAVEPVTRDFLKLAREAEEHSEDFLNMYLRKDWERSLDHFNGKHPAGSKYRADEYRGRSRLFRPKTRSTIRKGEAASAAAFFSTQDVVNIAPVDDSDPIQLASAETTNAIVNYRLTKSIKWFLLLQGAYQTAQIHGVVASKQYWKYEEKITPGEMTAQLDEYGNPAFDETGMPLMSSSDTREVIEDRPVIELHPPENVRIHEGADWTDPVNTSPFVICKIPMYAGAVRQLSRTTDSKTGQKWLKIDDPSLAKAKIDETSSIRQKRSGYDPVDSQAVSEAIPDHELVWANEVIMKLDGEDMVWWTLGKGSTAMLSEPVPLKSVYLHGIRPYVLGYGMLEAFTVFPASKVALLHDLQVSVNDVQNLTMDNVKLALNPRTQIAAGQNLDIKTATSGAPGSGVIVKNPGKDIYYDRPPDVAQSAFVEQDRLNNDFDEMAGNIASSSVQANRALGDTATGMAILSSGANALTEYDLRVFSETWVELVLRQLVKLEQAYETDTTVIALAGKKAAVWERYGLDPLLDDLLSADLTVTVNVGIGMTDPGKRAQRFMFAINSLMQLAGGLSQMLGPQALTSPGFEAIAKEIFGTAGYKDGQRFLQFDQAAQDPQMMQMGQQIQQMQQYIDGLHQQMDSKQMETQAKVGIEQMKAQTAMQTTQIKAGAEIHKAKISAQAQMQNTATEQLLSSLHNAARITDPAMGVA